MKRSAFLAIVPAVSIELCGAAPSAEPVPSPDTAITAESAAPVRSDGSTSENEYAPKERSVAITSDSLAFCARLLNVIDSRRNDTSNDVKSLREEGEHLCSEGRVRLGVARLREALLVLKGKQEP